MFFRPFGANWFVGPFVFQGVVLGLGISPFEGKSLAAGLRPSGR